LTLIPSFNREILVRGAAELKKINGSTHERRHVAGVEAKPKNHERRIPAKDPQYGDDVAL
jgi:hypothetical protein